MRDVLKSKGRWAFAGWLLPLVLLALPNCFLNSTGLGGGGSGGGNEFDGGDEPRSSAVMCNIPKVPAPGASNCATAAEAASGISKAYAAIALAQNEKSTLELDFSPFALDACGGLPQKVEMQGPYPDGSTICLNCGQKIPAVYADANAVCVARCIDLTMQSEFQPSGGIVPFCESNASVAINFDRNTCFGNACSSGGTPEASFVDPRRTQEPVKWIDFGGQATASANDLSKLTGIPGNFDSGAASDQTITGGDAWIEFSVTENTTSHVIGISHDNGTDNDPTLADIGHAISLNYDGNVYILEDGAAYVSLPYGTYSPGERFRIRITDNQDTTATISYWRVDPGCMPATICSLTPIDVQTLPGPTYPLRISASFREPGATLSNVTMVRIQDLP